MQRGSVGCDKDGASQWKYDELQMASSPKWSGKDELARSIIGSGMCCVYFYVRRSFEEKKRVRTRRSSSYCRSSYTVRTVWIKKTRTLFCDLMNPVMLHCQYLHVCVYIRNSVVYSFFALLGESESACEFCQCTACTASLKAQKRSVVPLTRRFSGICGQADEPCSLLGQECRATEGGLGQ